MHEGHHSPFHSSHAASSIGVSTPRRRHVHQRTRTHWSGYGRIRSKLYRSTGGSPIGRSSAVIPSSRARAISMTARSCVAAQTFSGQSPAGCPSSVRPGRASRRPLWPSRSSRRPKRLSSVMWWGETRVGLTPNHASCQSPPRRHAWGMFSAANPVMCSRAVVGIISTGTSSTAPRWLALVSLVIRSRLPVLLSPTSWCFFADFEFAPAASRSTGAELLGSDATSV